MTYVFSLILKVKDNLLNYWSFESWVCISAHTGVAVCNNQYFYSEIPYFSNSGAERGGHVTHLFTVSSRFDFLLSHYSVTLGTLSCSSNFDVGLCSARNEKKCCVVFTEESLSEIVPNCRQ